MPSSIESETRRTKARHLRREAAAPYSMLKHEKGKESEVSGRGTTHARGGGFFSRLATYIPIVNKLIQDDDVGGEKDQVELVNESCDEVKTTQEEEDDEEEELVEEEKKKKKEEEKEETSSAENKETLETSESLYSEADGQKKMLEDDDMMDTSVSPKSRASSSLGTDKVQVTMSSRQVNDKKESQVSSSSCESNTENTGRSPPLMPPWRKRGDKSMLPPGPSQPITHRRWKTTSASPHESALGVIKDKKTITLEEYERLQHQLFEMVETTPQKQLKMTQTALANGLEHPFTRGFPGPTSFPGYVPGSNANQNHGAAAVQDEKKRGSEYTAKQSETFSKRPRNHKNEPVSVSGTTLRGKMTPEERLHRKPRPSRLLTGTKRNTSARYAYSAAVAETILSTLNKLQSPLEQEAQKPTPSTATMWAKCHSAVVDGQKNSSSNEMEIDSDDVPPPTSTVPRVAFPQPQPSKKLADLSFGSTPNTTFETPPKSGNTVSNGVTSLFSPQAVAMTPAPIAKTSAPEQPQFETTGEFKFTLPVRVKEVKQADDEDTRVRFVFSPPLSMLEPPVRISNQRKAHKDGSAPAPFDFMPSSPKMKATAWVAKPSTVKELEERKTDSEKAIAAETAEESVAGPTASAAAPTVSLNSGANPLARFMQLKPGQWKCPGCSVLNEATSAKCPCCETTKPGGGVAEKASSVAPNASEEILSSDFSLGLASVEAKNGSDKSVAGSITESGFCFGAPSAESKKDTEKPAALMSSSGFTFSAPAASATTNKFAAKITSDGFSFGAHAASENPVVGDVDFSTAAESNTRADSFASTAPISFGFSAPVEKADEASTKMSTGIGKAVPASSFSFRVPEASEPTSDQTSATTKSGSVSSGFTFGVTGANTADGTSTGKRKAPEAEVSTNGFAPSFNFGATTAMNTEASKANTATGFSFGVATEPKQASPEESDRPTKRLAASTTASDSKPDASAFTFGAASKPPQVPAKESAETPSLTPLFNVVGPSSLSTTQKPEERTTSAFSFGATSTEEASVPTEAKFREMMPPKTGFTFGSSSPAEPKPTAGFGQHTESEARAFSVGASASTSTPATLAQATSTSASSSAGFNFGQNTMVATSNAPAFGAAPSSPAFGFGASIPTLPPAGKPSSSNAEMSSAAASTMASTFGLWSAKPEGSSAFGQTPASTSSFGSTSTAFGSSSSNVFGSGSNVGGFGSKSNAAPSTTFGNSASSAPATSAFSFEASRQAPAASAPAPTAAQPVFTFGASSNSAPSGYGAAPAASSGPSGGFGAAVSGFRSSSPAPAFGNQSAPAFTSNRPPLTSAFGTGFSSGPPSSGFPTTSSTPAFSAAQAAPPFGATPAPPFGTAPAPPFGAAPNTAFGATPNTAFGGTPNTAFGGTPNTAFGAAPNTAFGATASAPGFGAPTAGAFDAFADGGFNMGVAPQHAKNRRILKAKVRNRRTSSKRE
ncbi:hypothetical protein DD238_004563 [Peronospora effusa]|uniref:RanBP2-type domain-containing protein n=1 Tax=Peronospora effusa TaxID=542832 RepID=A0A3M6VHX7_9STRA|nr:hypothetical protein DD238_004563 [Peronospora effusa]